MESDEQGGSHARRLELDEEGYFLDEWPKGFFSERVEEAFRRSLPMIARVGLAADALLDDTGTSPATLAQLHRAVTRCLLAHAELTLADRDDERRLRDAITRLAPRSVDAAKAWEAVLTHARRRVVNSNVPSLSNIEDVSELRDEWRTHIDLAIVEGIRAELFGCPSDRLSFIDESGLEIAKCRANWEARTFAALRELSDRHVITGWVPTR